MESAVYDAVSGLVPRSPETRSSPSGSKSFTTMSSAELAIAATASICRVLPSVSSNSCFGPQSVAVISPWNG